MKINPEMSVMVAGGRKGNSDPRPAIADLRVADDRWSPVIAGAFGINTNDFQSTGQPATSSAIIGDINDFSWCSSKLHDSLILAVEDGTAFLWNVKNSNPTKRFNAHISRITSVDFNFTDDTFVTTPWDKTDRLWNVDEENCRLVYTNAALVSSVK